MAKEKFYAVRKGINPGIYLTWEECQAQVICFKDAEYKSFMTLEEAKDYISNVNEITKYSKYSAYIDGSYNVKTEEYSFGAVLITEEKEYKFYKKFEKDEWSLHRNVAGEIKGAGFIIQYAINHNIDEIDIYYDYAGIEKWYNNEWKANTQLTRTYQEFAVEAKKKIKVNFIKVKSHSNNKYNDLADELAKKALNI